jgi:hypothetical protein
MARKQIMSDRYEPTTEQARTDLLHEVDGMAWDTLTAWMRRWSDDAGRSCKVRWDMNGTAVLEVDGRDVFLFQVDITASVLDYVQVPESEPNKPTGFRVRRPWSAVPAGWFVKVPNGDARWEVLRTERVGPVQRVTLRMPDGTTGQWDQPPDREVLCQRGTLVTEAADALEVLGEGAEVLKDEL